MYKLCKQPCSLQTIYIISYQYTVCRESKKGYLVFNFALEATFSLGRGNFIDGDHLSAHGFHFSSFQLSYEIGKYSHLLIWKLVWDDCANIILPSNTHFRAAGSFGSKCTKIFEDEKTFVAVSNACRRILRPRKVQFIENPVH